MKNVNIAERQKVLEKKLKQAAKQNIEGLFKEYETSREGISIVELEEREENLIQNG